MLAPLQPGCIGDEESREEGGWTDAGRAGLLSTSGSRRTTQSLNQEAEAEGRCEGGYPLGVSAGS